MPTEAKECQKGKLQYTEQLQRQVRISSLHIPNKKTFWKSFHITYEQPEHIELSMMVRNELATPVHFLSYIFQI